MIREAVIGDLEALVALEERSFETDRISSRQFRYLLTRAHAVTLVDEATDGIRGDVVVLFRRGTSLARLYSIAIDESARGQGVGAALLAAAEQAAMEHGFAYMRAEIRTDNAPSLNLFSQAGYWPFAVHEDYYEDHSDAVRLEKRLVRRPEFRGTPVPFYQQTLDFTCGSASLMMAMKAVNPGFEADRRTEIRLWREATTVFMTSGHGGCGPYGLALAAHHRGYDVSLYVSNESDLFIDSVRSEEKKQVMRLVEEDFLEEIRHSGIPVHRERLTARLIADVIDEGRIPVVLISSWRMYQEKFPHWVVVTGADRSFLFVHDPYVDEEKGKSRTDSIDIPVTREEFERMARYGKAALQAAVIIGPPRKARGRAN